jgi:predicted transport protein
MFSEKDMEEAICSNPQKYLGEEGLKLIAQQYRIGGYIFDLLFEDRHGAKLIVEIQKGTLDRDHTYKILDYYDEYKEGHPNDFIELMVISNRIPVEWKKRLHALGITFKEIPESEFPSFNSRMGDTLEASGKDGQLISPSVPRMTDYEKSKPSTSRTSSGSKYTFDDLLRYSTPATWEMFLALRERILSISDSVLEVINYPHSTNYRIGVTFAGIRITKSKLDVWLRMGSMKFEDPLKRCRHTSGSGDYNTICETFNMDELDYAMRLVKQAYEYTSGRR